MTYGRSIHHQRLEMLRIDKSRWWQPELATNPKREPPQRIARVLAPWPLALPRQPFGRRLRRRSRPNKPSRPAHKASPEQRAADPSQDE